MYADPRCVQLPALRDRVRLFSHLRHLSFQIHVFLIAESSGGDKHVTGTVLSSRPLLRSSYRLSH